MVRGPGLCDAWVDSRSCPPVLSFSTEKGEAVHVIMSLFGQVRS
jgi:hypothetical protein